MHKQQNILGAHRWHVNNTPIYFSHIEDMPFLEISIIFNAGSLFDGKKLGLSQLTNAMLNQGAGHKSANDIATEFESLGAEFFADADRDEAIVRLRTLIDPGCLHKAITLFSFVLSHACFPTAALAALKKRYIGAIEMRSQMPEAMLKDAFYSAMYGNHPYANRVMGSAASVKTISKKNIIDFYKRHYVASNATLVLIGGIGKSKAEKIVRSLLKDLPGGNAIISDNSVQIPIKAMNRHIPFSVFQANVTIGGMSAGYHDPDYFPLLVACHIVGGSHQSRLFSLMRKKHGFSYDASINITSLKLSSYFAILLQTKVEQLSDAINAVKNLLLELQKKGPSQRDFLTAKAELINRFPLTLANYGGVAGCMIKMAMHHLPLHYFDYYQDNIGKVSLQQVKDVYKKYFTVSNIVTISVGEVDE